VASLHQWRVHLEQRRDQCRRVHHPGTSSGNDGNLYRVAVSNALGAITSSSATLTCPTLRPSPPSPRPVGHRPNAATFTAAAAGDPAPTLQWQVSTNGGTSWTPIIGAYGPSYSTGATSFSNDGNLYQVVASNGVGSPPPATPWPDRGLCAVLHHPAIAQSVAAPATATFTAAAQGDPAPATNGTCPPTGDLDSGSRRHQRVGQYHATSAANNGTYYQVQASNPAGTATSASVGLTVGFARSSPSPPRTAGSRRHEQHLQRHRPGQSGAHQLPVAGCRGEPGTATSTYADLTLNGITVSQPVNLIVTSTAGTSTTPGGPASVNVLSPYAGAFMAGEPTTICSSWAGTSMPAEGTTWDNWGSIPVQRADLHGGPDVPVPNFISLANIVQVDAAGITAWPWMPATRSGGGVPAVARESPEAPMPQRSPDSRNLTAPQPGHAGDNAASSFALLGDGTSTGGRWGQPAQVTGLPSSAPSPPPIRTSTTRRCCWPWTTRALWACESPTPA